MCENLSKTYRFELDFLKNYSGPKFPLHSIYFQGNYIFVYTINTNFPKTKHILEIQSLNLNNFYKNSIINEFDGYGSMQTK